MESAAGDQHLSTTQVAAALGVSVSTVKRWVEDGVLPAEKTAGGHRKLLLANVLEVARRERLPTSDLGRLVGAPRRRAKSVDTTSLEKSLYQAMLTGQGDEVRQLILGAYQSGIAIESIADQIISPALCRIGHDWEMEKIDVMHEHRGTQLCAAALFELKAMLERRVKRNRPVAIGGAPAHDYSVLPTLLAQMVLLDAGWEAVNLGANTPLGSLQRAVVEMRPRLAWLSVSHLDHCDTFMREYRDFYHAAEQKGVAVVVGGRALGDAIRATIPYSSHGDGLTHLAAFARMLNPQKRRRPRGRPRVRGEH